MTHFLVGMCVFISVLSALTSIAMMMPELPTGAPWFYLANLSAACAAGATWVSLSVLSR